MKERLNPFCYILAAVILVFAIASTVNGQEGKAIDCYDQTVLRAGEGSYGFVPSWFVMVKVRDRHSATFYGSGAFLTNRLVLTCNHNVEGAANVLVKNGTGDQFFKVKVVQVSPKLDLALLLIEDEEVPYHRTLQISGENFTPKGRVHAVGYDPGEDAICRYEGTLTGKSYGRPGFPGVVSHGHSAKVVQGMSGGPLLDDYLEIVGVNTHSSPHTKSLATNLTRLQWFLDQYKGDKGEK